MKKLYKSIFSVVLLLCGLTVSLTACSHDGGETPEKPNTEDPSSDGTTPNKPNPDTPQQKGDSILAQLVPTPAAKSGQDLEGFLVGDKIYYDLKITDAKGPESSTYTLDLEGAGRVENHRQIGKDFALFVAKVKADGSAKDWNEVKSFPYTLPSKGDYRLMYESKTDGTFDHKYQLKRQSKGKSDSKITNLPIVFYVLDVDIAYAVEKSIMFEDDVVGYLMGIKVKCGSLPTDKLLETFDPIRLSLFIRVKIIPTLSSQMFISGSIIADMWSMIGEKENQTLIICLGILKILLLRLRQQPMPLLSNFDLRS